MRLEQAFERLERTGLSILYSSDLVKPWMRVREEPQGNHAQTILAEILSPYDLKAAPGPNGSLLLVRAASSRGIDSASATDTESSAIRPDAFMEVIVSASRYRLVQDLNIVPATASLSAAELKSMPDLGDDPVRAVARLPGTANADFSAKTSMRGGEADETLVRFDGLRLYNPFHLKDFQSLFSAIDPAVVRQIDVYTGAFPVTYGDRMSGVIDIVPLAPRSEPYREISVSLFNASTLLSDSTHDSAWLFAARRGNLDLIFDVADPTLGKPRYMDLYGRFERQVADSVALSGNLLMFDDSILLFDGDQEEEARAAYRDEYVWLRIDHRPSAALSGNFLLAHSSLKSERRGRAELPGVVSGMLEDRRAFTIDSLQTDWSWHINTRSLLQFGAEWRASEGRYDYRDQVAFELLFLTPGAAEETQRARQLSARPQGKHYGVYTNLRLEALSNLAAEAGLRWDRETISPDKEGQFSPRLSLRYGITDRTGLRLSWGRFFQSQAIHELQIADGVAGFYPPQRSDHWLAALERRQSNGVDVRLEVYRKDYRTLRPRFENLLNTFILLPELKPDRIRVAPQRAVVKGAEISFGHRNSGPHSWWLSYTWSSAHDIVDGTKTPRNWDQAHAISGGVSWHNDRWELSIAGLWHSGWPTTDLTLIETEPAPLVATGTRNARRLGNYAALNARAERTFRFQRAGSLGVFLELSNLLNRTNDCCIDYQIEDESEDLLLDIEPVDYLPALPSLGFVWRF